jgi:predicted RNA-binding Zn ribbon-like protein
MGRLVAIAFEAINARTWTRLKACPADGCHRAFYDASRNRSSGGAIWACAKPCQARDLPAPSPR